MSDLERLDPAAGRRRSIALAVRVALGLGLVAFLAVSLLSLG